MKIFPKLARRTNLSPDELKVYYSIRFNYILPYNERVKLHEQSLLSLAMALLRGGKVNFELADQSCDVHEESKVSASQIAIQFSHSPSGVTIG